MSGGTGVRFRFILVVLGSATAAGLLLSAKLWLTERSFPHAPVWDRLPDVPSPWDRTIYVTMLLLLVLAAVLPRPRLPLMGFVLLAGTWSLWDQSRWQPWFYQYLFMLAALGFTVSGDEGRRRTGLNVCRFILAATYFWSGIQKINFNYATVMHPWILEPIVQRLPDGLGDLLIGLGYPTAFIECGLGIGLLVPPLRIIAAIMLALMHATILVCLSPMGHGINSVVWPWNLAMIVLNIALVIKTREIRFQDIIWPARFLFARVVLLLFGVMPVLSFFNMWDAYLSAALYSANTLDARIHLSESAQENLPPIVRLKFVSDGDLDLFSWSMEEMNVPDYPARRVYRAIARRLGQVPGDVFLEIDERPNWRTGERVTTIEPLGWDKDR